MAIQTIRPGVGLCVEADLAAAWRAGAEMIARAVTEAVSASGAAAIAISGGQTPRGMHRLLAEPPYGDAIPWERLHVFWVDERLVPYHDAASNFGAARSDWFDRLPRKPAGLHPVPVGPPEQAADRYADELRAFARRCGTADPVFDLVELGVGPDGHTASLFPQHPALEERTRWTAAVKGGSPDVWRVSLTFPVLNRARRALFLTAGEAKADIVHRTLTEAPPVLPAGRIRPAAGEVTWVLDRAAARLVGKIEAGKL
jgi:6-phosphogluconolactonase